MKFLYRALACFQLLELLIQYPIVCALTLPGDPSRGLRHAALTSIWRFIRTGVDGLTLPEIDAMYQGALHLGDRAMAQEFLDMRDQCEEKYGG
jgi:hypothetical protein